ncbi:hypothetical protein CVT25_011744 [Psilocybe cyanescens]|uniref:DUF6533 domain-containing protein n=1 Tax=Psilocybe cyanescens TaxID=93625 RepID=A0A409WIG9_PSICY|nr:hypothetical protein CVT25_011744 [Psilocybe cyanescens]
MEQVSSNSQLNSEDEQLFVYECILLASFVILYYDYILTFPDEFNRYWNRSRKITIATILFFLNRYLTTLGYLPFFILYIRPTTSPNRLEVSRSSSESIRYLKSCQHFDLYHVYLVIAIQVIIGTISVLRTYALYGRSRRILVLLCTSTVIAAAFGLFCSFTSRDDYTEMDFPSKSCLLPLSDRASKRQLVGWAGLVAFEVLIFGLILFKSIMLTTKMNGTYAIIDVMLRDGAVYFGIIALSSTSVIITFRLNKKHERGMTATLTNSLASSMITRLMLNLRDPSLASGTLSRVGTRPILSRLSFVTGFEAAWTTQIDSMLPASLEDSTDSDA